jgi:hypothetical protein
LERDFEGYASRELAQDLNAPIFPRVGDISALRDPYSANVDRCFFRFPLWTIHKTLYVFDMHQRAVHISDQIQGSTSSGSLQSSTGSTICDDEDVTLVADDKRSFEKQTLDNGSHQECLLPEGSPPCTWDAIRAWELNWYARWELLIGLVQRDQALRQAAPLSPSTTPSGFVDEDLSPLKELLEPFTPKAPTPVFHFAGEDGEEDDGDEEDDYGTLVANPIYNVDETFKEGYHRAVNFFSKGRGLKRERRLRTVSG